MYNDDMNTQPNTAYAIVYAYNRAQSGGVTPAYTTIEAALAHLYRSGVQFDTARIRRVPLTAETRTHSLDSVG